MQPLATLRFQTQGSRVWGTNGRKRGFAVILAYMRCKFVREDNLLTDGVGLKSLGFKIDAEKDLSAVSTWCDAFS